MDFSRAHRTDIQVRFSDTDALGHVNNVAYAVYLETARVAALSGLSNPPSLVVAHLEIDYRREIRLGQRVTVELLVTHIGRSSWTYHYRVLADGALAAEANTVQVVINPLLMRPDPIPAELRAWLSDHADLPEAEAARD